MKINLFLIGKRNIVLIGLLLLGSFSFAQNPIINSIIPTAAKPGDTIQIVGDYFSTSTDSNKVFFGIVPGKIVSASRTKILALVPVSASTSPITVTTRNRTTQSNKIFRPYFSSKKYPFHQRSLQVTPAIPVKSLTEYQTVPNGSEIVTAYDLNNDGKPELITSVRDSNTVSIFKNISNNKTPNFSSPIKVSTGLSLSDVQIADIDADGLPDLITANNHQNTISILKNKSTNDSIQFEERIFFPITSPYQAGLDISIRITDFNKDGLLDIFTFMHYSGTASVLINNSSATAISFKANLIRYHITPRIEDIFLRDLDEDNYPELVVLNSDLNNPSLIIFQTKPQARDSFLFAKVFEYNLQSYVTAFTLNNFNSDEKPDILIGSVELPSSSPKNLQLFINTTSNGNISFKLSQVDTIKTGGFDMVAGDLTGDLKNEVLIKNGPPGGMRLIQHKLEDSVINLSNTFVLGSGNIDFAGQKLKIVDLNYDGKPDVFGLLQSIKGIQISILVNEHDNFPIIKSFSPTNAGYGDTINIKGYNFSGVTSVKFKDSAAASYVIVSDTLIKAVVGKSESGYIFVSSSYGTDTLGGFIFNHPTITFSPSPSLTFPAIKGKTSKAHPYTVKAKNLQGSIQITAPRFFEVSRSADSGFSQTTTLQPILGKIDSANIYVRFKTDSSVTTYSDSMQHSTPGLAVTTYALSVNICDSIILFKPYINNISKDSTIFCFKQDTLTLSVTNGSNFNVYKWSTGDTVSVSRIANSQNASIRVGSSITCLSEPSPIVRFVKNTNTIPSIGLTNDSILVSTNAPFYKWYFNNRLMGDSSSSITAKKVGFYKVETSNDKLCWDASTSYPIISLPNLASTDTVRIRIFPNPVSGGFFNVVASLDRVTNVIARVTVTDASGLILVQTNKFIFFGREIKIPITLSTYKGTAFVRVEINGDVETKTIILQ